MCINEEFMNNIVIIKKLLKQFIDDYVITAILIKKYLAKFALC